MTCLILVGAAGAGKSTIAQILTGDSNIKTSSGWKSCTKFSRLYSIGNNLYVLDTRGIMDTNGVSPKSIIEDMVKILAPKGIKKIKIILCFDSTGRLSHESVLVLKWVHKINKNIWSSAILIVKKGRDEDDYNHVINYLKDELYVYTKLLAYNITLIDKLKSSNRDVKLAKKMSKYERYNEGLIYTYEYKDWLKNKLDFITYSSISYKKQYYHSGSRKYKYIHTDEYRMHRGTATTLVSHNFLTLGMSAIIMGTSGGYEACRYWHCCKSDSRHAKGCTKRFVKWTCCSNSEYDSGCKYRWVVS